MIKHINFVLEPLIGIVFFSFLISCSNEKSNESIEMKDSIENLKPGNEYSSIKTDTVSFDYFMSLFAKREIIPQYLCQKYFTDRLLQYLVSHGTWGSFHVRGQTHSTIKNINVVTFVISHPDPCLDENIATFDLNGSMIDYHSVFSGCDCVYDSSPCDRWELTVKNDSIIKLEHLERDRWSDETIIEYEYYVIKTNGRIERKRSIENETTDSRILDDLTSDSQVQIDVRAADFIKNLKNGEELSSLFVENWKLIYHEDNRCAGSTDGQIDQLTSLQIDSNINLYVKNDGDGWACDKKDPKTYSMDFDLKKKMADWDRIEIRNQEKNTVYVVGKGESDWLVLHYSPMGLIVEVEYRSEDPG